VPAPVPWSRFDEISAWPTVGEPFADLGHPGEGGLGRVRVSPEARAGYEALVRDSTMPDGTVVGLFHGARSGSESGTGSVDAGSVYVMEKERGAWAFRVLTPRGVIVEAAVGLCAACHEGGVGDRLFGLPRAAGAAH